MSCSRQGSIGLQASSHKTVEASNSEQNSGCLETWDRLGEETGTGRSTYRTAWPRSWLSCLCQKLGLQPSRRDLAGQSPGPCRWQERGLSLPSSLAALCSRCHVRSVRSLPWERAQASTEPGCFPELAAASTQPFPSRPWGPGGATSGSQHSPLPALPWLAGASQHPAHGGRTRGYRSFLGGTTTAEPQEGPFSLEGAWLSNQSPTQHHQSSLVMATTAPVPQFPTRAGGAAAWLCCRQPPCPELGPRCSQVSVEVCPLLADGLGQQIAARLHQVQ